LERELGLHSKRRSVHFRIGIDEVVEGVALLRWVEAGVSSNRKLQVIVVICPEKIILLIGIFLSF
jgi:hypothetical protein